MRQSQHFSRLWVPLQGLRQADEDDQHAGSQADDQQARSQHVKRLCPGSRDVVSTNHAPYSCLYKTAPNNVLQSTTGSLYHLAKVCVAA